jgi:transposase
MLYLASYSPNLNLIERLWKFVKKQVLYPTFRTSHHEYLANFQGRLS